MDYDIKPALAAGMKAVLVRRGLWELPRATKHDPVPSIASLSELPAMLE